MAVPIYCQAARIFFRISTKICASLLLNFCPARFKFHMGFGRDQFRFPLQNKTETKKNRFKTRMIESPPIFFPECDENKARGQNEKMFIADK